MRVLLILASAFIPAVAQNPSVQLTNTSRPSSLDFQIGDRFEIAITGAANQPVSVRTTTGGRTDWGPVMGSTDASGRWSMMGQFDKGDFGYWSELWTVGGKLVNPPLNFQVGWPCLKNGEQPVLSRVGMNAAQTCDTADGPQTFVIPSFIDPFRTPDGRMVPGLAPSNMTQEQFHEEVLLRLITGSPGSSTDSMGFSRGSDLEPSQHGDAEAALIRKMIGVNALSENETRNVLEVVRAAFEKPDRIPQEARNPYETLRLLRNLSDSTSQESLKQQIAETIAYVHAQ